MIVVPDAGPLIYLGGAGHIQLLRALYTEVVVPRIVVDEVVIAGVGLPGDMPTVGISSGRLQFFPHETLERVEALCASGQRTK